MRAVIRTLVPCLAALAATGCLGGTHNPSYFPFYLPTGDIIRTHAKPPGTGYFRNFDPKACKVEVSPACVTSPTKSRQVFVATVFDSDGQPRRARRVEWILDGPGSIVEVDESGYFPGRGYKVDNRYAVSYTDYFEHCISRGNDDPRDDFTIRPGQTWCVVSCPVEGQTTVTAYAPGVFDWDQGRALATVTWSDSAFQFPPATTVRSGGETELTTTVAHPSDTAGRPVDYKVRYRIVGGTPASLVPRSGSTGTYAANAQEAEALADATGAAGVRVTQPTPQPGKTRVAVEVLKPDPNGIGRGTVVGRTETVVEWSSPQVTLDVKLPRAVPLDRETHVPIVLANAGSVDATAATVRAAMPEGAEFVRADPPPTQRGSRDLTWELGPVPGGERRTVTMILRPTRRGPVTLTVAAETAGGLRADQTATATADAAGLKVTADAESASLGGTATVRVRVANTGAVPLDRATAWVTVGEGLQHESGTNPVEVPVGPVEAGQATTVDVPFATTKAGRVAVRVNVAANGATADRTDTTVTVTRSGLSIAVTGPEAIPVRQEGLFEIRVTNTGDAPAANAKIRATLPQGVVAKSASDGGRIERDGEINWPLGPLNAGEAKVVRLSVTGDRLADRQAVAVAASADGPSGGSGLSAKASAAVAITGQPVLVLELADPAGPVPVGGRATYRVTVRNRGTGPAHNLAVVVDVNGGLTPTRGTGPSRTTATIATNQASFSAIESLPAGGSATFTLDADATTAGDARVTVRVTAKELTALLQEEQATRVLTRR